MNDPQRRRWRSLSCAFTTWLDAQSPVLKSEVVASKRRGRIVMRFPRFPVLRGLVWNHCLAVYAGRESDAYRLFDLDCLPISSDYASVFVCGFCEGNRKAFESREALWADHLFDPFGHWVTHILMQAKEIEHKRIGRWSFARFHMPETWSDSDIAIFKTGGVDHWRFYRKALRRPSNVEGSVEG